MPYECKKDKTGIIHSDPNGMITDENRTPNFLLKSHAQESKNTTEMEWIQTRIEQFTINDRCLDQRREGFFSLRRQTQFIGRKQEHTMTMQCCHFLIVRLNKIRQWRAQVPSTILLSSHVYMNTCSLHCLTDGAEMDKPFTVFAQRKMSTGQDQDTDILRLACFASHFLHIPREQTPLTIH